MRARLPNRHMPRMFLIIAAICWLATTVNCSDAPKGSATVSMNLGCGIHTCIVGPAESRTQEAAAAASAAATPSDAAVTPQQSALYQPILDLHNSYRAKHGVPALTWSATLATSAANYAKECKWEHSTLGFGENLFLATMTDAAAVLAEAIKQWYDEITLYDFSNPGFSLDTGHFTQVVWKETTELGCAVHYCTQMKNAFPGNYVVCHYTPPGNVLGQFAEMVPRVGGGGGGGGGGVIYDPSTAIESNKMLRAPGCIIATNQRHRLCVMRNGDVQIQTFNARLNAFRRSWSTGVRAPVGATRPFALGLYPDGNLAAFDSQLRIYWQTGTGGVGTTPHVAVLRDTGNLFLYDNTGRCIWSAKNNCALRRTTGGP